jgi:hypothetical protein
MKKAMYFAIGLTLVFSSVVLADVPFPFIDSFEAEAAGDKPSNWEIVDEGDSTSIMVVAGISGANGKCLELQDNGGANYELVTMWEGSSPPDLVLEYRVMFAVLPGGVNSFFYVTTAPDGRWGEAGAAVASNADGLVHHDGGNWSPVTNIDLDRWYSVKYHIKIPAQTFDVYVDGTKVVTDSPFRNSAASMDNLRKLWLASDGGPTQYVYLDDIMVYDMSSPPAAVSPKAKISITWGEIRSAY